MASNSYILNNEIRLVVIGKTGAGKSATANTLIGKKVFQSSAFGQGVTKKTKKVEGTYKGRKVVLVDTPGVFDSGMDTNLVRSELAKCVGVSAPGPHCFLLVLKVDRMTPEELQTLKFFYAFFGDSLYKYMMLVFTRIDDLERANQSLETFVESCPKHITEIIQQCNGGYIGINNVLDSNVKKEAQLEEFYGKLDNMVLMNGETYYTNVMYQAIEAIIQYHVDEVMADLRCNKESQWEQRQKEREDIVRERGIFGKLWEGLKGFFRK